ncbi:MAG: hypothetical protein M0032_12285 [Actinomycetota bacterium]|nr:hypothetical protein [Actinomycetota bacterium]
MPEGDDAGLLGYDLYGLRVWSEVDLGFGGVHRGPEERGGGSLTLRLGEQRPVRGELAGGREVARRPNPDGSVFYTATADPDGYRFRVHGHLDFAVSAGLDEVRVDWDPSVDVDEVGLYFVGTVLSFVRTLGGCLTLHGSAVRDPGASASAVGFLGPSGSGKTTAAALALARGYAMVSDDVLCLDAGRRPPVLLGGCDELRMRPEASWAIEAVLDRPGVETRRTADGRVAIFDRRSRCAHRDGVAALRLLVLPEPDRTCRELEVEAVSPAEALLVVAGQPRLTGWVDRDVLAAQFTASADLVEAVPVVRARLPWASDRAAEAVASLLGASSPWH